MQFTVDPSTNPFAILSFLAAPAILTNASTLLALSTSNRLARASDRARLASATILAMKDAADPVAVLQHKDFQYASSRAQLLVRSLRSFYLAAGCFAAGTIIALVGAFAQYFKVPFVVTTSEILTIVTAVIGVAALSAGAVALVRETRIALVVLAEHHAAITQWRATHQPPHVSPTL